MKNRDKPNFHIIKNRKIAIKRIHGTGCGLSTAIACNMALGLDVAKAVSKANSYIYRAIASNLKAGKGAVVLRHFG